MPFTIATVHVDYCIYFYSQGFVWGDVTEQSTVMTGSILLEQQCSCELGSSIFYPRAGQEHKRDADLLCGYLES